MNPFFSIGVVTYNRREMLKDCLSSILRQTFSDFEIIVGNDFPKDKLSAEFLGIHDPRIQFVNNVRNLGEIKNGNAVLKMSRGKYFTWFDDDDMYAPSFLHEAYAFLSKLDSPDCVFTSYMTGDIFPEKMEFPKSEVKLFSGREFLRQYLLRKIKTQGCYGLFKAEYLKGIGGMEQLGNGSFSPYSDNLLVIRAGLLKRIVYIDSPLVFFRTHAGSGTWTNADVDAYRSAQADFLSKSVEIFKELYDDFYSNLFLLLEWCVSDYSTVMIRSGFLQIKKLIKYNLFIMRYALMLKQYCCRMIWILHRSMFYLIRIMVKTKFCHIFRSANH